MVQLGTYCQIMISDHELLQTDVATEDRLNQLGEFLPESIEPSLMKTPRATANIERIGRWIVAGIAGGAASLGILQLAQPGADELIGPVRIDVSNNGQGGVSALGEKLDGPMGLVGTTFNIQAPYPKEIQDVLEEGSEISTALETEPDLWKVLNNLYGDDFKGLALEALLKSSLLAAIAGGIGFTAANELLKRGTDEKRRASTVLAASSLGMLMAFGANIGLTYRTFDTEQAGKELDEKAIRPYIEDYFTDKTTKVLIDVQTIKQEISKNFTRLSRYNQAIGSSRKLNPDLVWLVIRSDDHDGAPYTEIEAIDRMVGASANISLGDHTNRGTDAENELLTGPELFGVDFEGIQDIRACSRWNSLDPIICDEEGSVIQDYSLVGNHDSLATRQTLDKLGSIDISRRSFSLPGSSLVFVGQSDGCFATEANCHTNKGDSEANRKAGEDLKKMIERNGIKPQAVFVAHPDIAKALDGVVPVIFAGGPHRDDMVRLPKGTMVYVVGTAGQALGREAKDASVTLAGFNEETGRLEDCRVASWQGLNSMIWPTLKVCQKTTGKL